MKAAMPVTKENKRSAVSFFAVLAAIYAFQFGLEKHESFA
jgi:hypothetical protein